MPDMTTQKDWPATVHPEVAKWFAANPQGRAVLYIELDHRDGRSGHVANTAREEGSAVGELSSTVREGEAFAGCDDLPKLVNARVRQVLGNFPHWLSLVGAFLVEVNRGELERLSRVDGIATISISADQKPLAGLPLYPV